MSDCCKTESSHAKASRKAACPLSGTSCSRVSLTTMLHHLKKPWSLALKQQGYYFCDDPDCDVVYFGEDQSTFKLMDVRTSVGIKDATEDALTCYCYGVSRAMLKADPGIKAFVTEQTRNGSCACEMRNPSGKCCLKHFV